MLEQTHHETTAAEALAVSEKYLSARKTRARYSEITDTTIDRWRRDKGFPDPVYLSGRRYWRERDLAKWEREQARQEEARRAALDAA